jgi:hypothetical protein
MAVAQDVRAGGVDDAQQIRQRLGQRAAAQALEHAGDRLLDDVLVIGGREPGVPDAALARWVRRRSGGRSPSKMRPRLAAMTP